MGILCVLCGHRPEEGYYHDHKGDSSRYMNVEKCGVDGMGREHANIKTECRRCGARFIIGKIHLPQRESEKHVISENNRLKELVQIGGGI